MVTANIQASSQPRWSFSDCFSALNPIPLAIRILQTAKPLCARSIDASVEIMKNEKLAVTSLVLSVLGIFPLWTSLAITISSIAYLAIKLHTLRATLAQSQQEMGTLKVANGDLSALRNTATAEMEQAIHERATLREEKEHLKTRVSTLEATMADLQPRQALLQREQSDTAQDRHRFAEERLAHVEKEQKWETQRQELEQARERAEAERMEALQARDEALAEKQRLQERLAHVGLGQRVNTPFECIFQQVQEGVTASSEILHTTGGELTQLRSMLGRVNEIIAQLESSRAKLLAEVGKNRRTASASLHTSIVAAQ